jgi:hypothetical protein
LRTALLLSFFLFYSIVLHAQLTISGTVLDKSKINRVENVQVRSSGGMFTSTDTMGRYAIQVKQGDTLTFVYKNKATQPFAVNNISNPNQFDISLHLNIESKYSVLKEVVVYSKTFKQDSIENRQNYANIFSYSKPGISTSVVPGGGVGADVNELINIFRFRRNKRLKAFQQRLEIQEQEKYVDYRFNKITIGRMTGLSGERIDSFLVWYRPSYEFTQMSSEIVFNQYILNASYQFRKIMPIGEAKKEEHY